MAIYHASTKPIARSAGRSAVAAAAYRAGTELVDARTGLVHDYTRKGGVERTEILTPDGVVCERNALWNAAELAEKRKDARTAREWVIALPSELDAEQRAALARDFAQALVTWYGVAADLAIHAPDREGDHRNYHAHILTTTRQVSRGPDGAVILGDKALIERSDDALRKRGLRCAADEVKAVRELWERTANAALERAGVAARIDARSLQAQGMDREATQHLGPVASEMERRGKASDRGDGNRTVLVHNTERERLAAEIIDLQAALARREQILEGARLRHAQRDALAIQERWRVRQAERAKRLKRESILERARVRQGYRMDSWEIRERWSFRQQEREREREADRLLEEQEAEKYALEFRRQEVTEEAEADMDRIREEAPKVDGIRPVGDQREHWLAWRKDVLERRYDPEFSRRMIEEQDVYCRWRKDYGGLHLVGLHGTGGAGIVDTGPMLKLPPPLDGGQVRYTRVDLVLMVETAKAKGWSTVRLSGSPDFQFAFAKVAVEAGLHLSDSDLEARAYEATMPTLSNEQAAREDDEKRTRPRGRGRGSGLGD